MNSLLSIISQFIKKNSNRVVQNTTIGFRNANEVTYGTSSTKCVRSSIWSRVGARSHLTNAPAASQEQADAVQTPVQGVNQVSVRPQVSTTSEVSDSSTWSEQQARFTERLKQNRRERAEFEARFNSKFTTNWKEFSERVDQACAEVRARCATKSDSTQSERDAWLTERLKQDRAEFEAWLSTVGTVHAPPMQVAKQIAASAGTPPTDPNNLFGILLIFVVGGVCLYFWGKPTSTATGSANSNESPDSGNDITPGE